MPDGRYESWISHLIHGGFGVKPRDVFGAAYQSDASGPPP